MGQIDRIEMAGLQIKSSGTKKHTNSEYVKQSEMRVSLNLFTTNSETDKYSKFFCTVINLFVIMKGVLKI